MYQLGIGGIKKMCIFSMIMTVICMCILLVRIIAICIRSSENFNKVNMLYV